MQVECALQLGYQGCVEQAQTALAGALPLVQKALGPSHPSVAKALTCQATMLIQQQQLDQVTICGLLFHYVFPLKPFFALVLTTLRRPYR